MKRNLMSVVGISLFLAVTAFGEKAFKGEAPTPTFNLGAMGGIGVLNGEVGASFQGTAAVKVINKGFADDINNQVFVEAQFGPLFVANTTAFQYSFLLRWDFVKDADWTFYGIGGLGGIVTGTAYKPFPASPAGATSLFYPRFGIGAMWGLFELVSVRFELSHELIGLGAVVLL